MFSPNDLNFLDGEDSFDPTIDSLDGMDSFDPNGGIVDKYRNPKGRGVFNATKGKEGIITLRIQNKQFTKKRFELFNALKHITKIPNPSQYANTGEYVPISSGYIAAFMAVSGTVPGDTTNPYLMPKFTVMNDFTGSHVYCAPIPAGSISGGAVRAKLLAGQNVNWEPYADVIVSCSQMPYRQLLDAFSSTVWRVSKTKLQTSSENQIKNSFDFVYNGSLGSQENNSFEPSEFFLPQNQQTKVIDIPKKYEIDANTAIYVDIEPQEDMQITFFVEAFRNNSIKW